MPASLHREIETPPAMNRRPLLVLASRSPRRQMLLRQAGFDFQLLAPAEHVEDNRRSGEETADYVVRLARQKAEDVVGQAPPERIVVACDTLAECNGQILGKPRDREHAGEMLRCLRGRVHQVLSGVCLLRGADRRIRSAVDRTTLRMDEFSDAELAAYLDSGQWQGKAGAFGYQDGIDWVHIIAGSESNVVGLPMELLQTMLEQFEDVTGRESGSPSGLPGREQ
jgi:septum formation protein